VISILDGRMTITRCGRVIFIQLITDESYYLALKAFGARESTAAAAAAGLITMKTGAK
jgi:hypothetical protein